MRFFNKGKYLPVSMRYFGFEGLLLAFLIVSCNNKQQDRETVSETTIEQDSVENYESDIFDESLSEEEAERSDEKLMCNVDEFFGDFIFLFVNNHKLQLNRIDFPLPSIKIIDGKPDTTWFEQKKWIHDRIFPDKEYYTVLFSHKNQMDMENNTNLQHINVEQIFLNERYIKNYHFAKEQGVWRLNQISYTSFPRSGMESFLDFYHKFVSNEQFQQQSVADPLNYITSDPEDDFSTIEGTLSSEQWMAFRPELPQKMITNICYGQKFDQPSRMIFIKRGFSSGMMNILTFTHKNGKWKLISYEN